MKIQINLIGRTCITVSGEVLKWTSSVERFGEVYLQVPSVIILCDDGRIHTVNLQYEPHRFHTVEIKKLSD